MFHLCLTLVFPSALQKLPAVGRHWEFRLFFGRGGGVCKVQKKEEKEVKTSYSRQEKLPMSNDNVFQNLSMQQITKAKIRRCPFYKVHV